MPLINTTQYENAVKGIGDAMKVPNVVKKAYELIFDATPKEQILGIAQPTPMVNAVAPMIFAGEKALGASQPQRWFSNLADKLPRFEIGDKGAKILKNMSESKYSEPLSNILHHPELYENYPALAKVRVGVNPNMEQGIAAQYTRPTQGKIKVQGFEEMNPARIDVRSIGDVNKDTLLHEIQHAVQEIEGLAKGGSPEEFRGMDTPLGKKLREWNKYVFPEALTPTEAYQRLAGEIEARDVASRMNLSRVVRARRMPYESQGIPVKEWITNR